MYNIRYSVKPVTLSNGSNVWGIYENYNLVTTRTTKREAYSFMETYRRLMR